MVEFGTSSAFRGWVRVRVLGYGFKVRGRKVKSHDCALASDLVRATKRCTPHAPSCDFRSLRMIEWGSDIVRQKTGHVCLVRANRKFLVHGQW